jgi:hypothetical protein
MPEQRSHRESSTLAADGIPIQADHLFQAIPTTHSDEAGKVAAFRTESVVAFRRNQWSPSRRNRWPLSPGKRTFVGIAEPLAAGSVGDGASEAFDGEVIA